MPLETPARIVRELACRGYNADREAVTLIASTDDPAAALAAVVDRTDDGALRLTAADVRAVVEKAPSEPPGPADDAASDLSDDAPPDPSVSGGDDTAISADGEGQSAVETEGSGSEQPADGASAESLTADAGQPTSRGPPPDGGSTPAHESGTTARSTAERDPSPPEITGDVTGESTGTGEYEQFVATFRDRYERLSELLSGRVNHRPASAVAEMSGGSDAAMIGLVDDVATTANGHRIIDLEDTTGAFSCLVTKDRDLAGAVDELLCDECVAVEGTLADDAGVLFVDSLQVPDVPRTNRPSTADRHVQAALVSDLHVGSQEFDADAWQRFADWLDTPEASAVEYLLIAGDMVEGVGVYPDQDDELDIVDIYAQYERFSEHLKSVPGDVEIVMIPGNHDAVRLAEPQPGFDEDLRGVMSAHDARITGNPSTVTVEGVSVLMYHGVSLDEVIAETQTDASYDEPHRAMLHLLRKRHLAPQYGGHMRLAPEERDYLVIEDVPDVFHAGHVHKLGYGKYRGVLAVNSACWQAQTAFQRSVNIDPDVGYAPILDLDTLELTVRKFT